jgi:hypothetical protein
MDNSDNYELNTDFIEEISNSIEDSPSPISVSSPVPVDLSIYQSNLDTFYKKFEHDLTFIYKAVPLAFYLDYKPVEIYEQSHKIIAPKDLLTQLTGYENLELPVYIKLNDSDRIFGIVDYIDFIDHIYIPSNTFYELNLEENSEAIITILKEPPAKATEIKIKPLNEEFYEIQNIKTYLEIWLKKMYITLSSGEIINLPYRNGFISLYIEELVPESIVSIYDIDEVKIDLLPMDEYANANANAVCECLEEPKGDTIENGEDNTEPFKSFSGKGNRLGST